MLVEKQGLTRLGTGATSAPALCTINNQLLLISRSSDTNQKYWLWKRIAGAWQAPRLLSEPPQAGGESYAPLAPPAAGAPRELAGSPSVAAPAAVSDPL
jgi:hypothetical protein